MPWKTVFIAILWIALSHARHYSFQKEGTAIFSSHMAHLAIPLEVVNLKAALSQFYNLATHVITAKNNATIHAAAP